MDTSLRFHPPPLPVSSPVHVLSPSPPTSPIRPLGYQAAMIRLRAEAASTSHSLPLPSPIIPSHTRPDAPPLGTQPLNISLGEIMQDLERVRRLWDHRPLGDEMLGGSTAGSDYKATGSRPQEAGGDYKDAGGRSKEAEAVHRGTKAAEEASDSDDNVRETAGTHQRSYTARCTQRRLGSSS
ncbi:hypothetical protein Tco_1420508 [Tanacetum coccineum]